MNPIVPTVGDFLKGAAAPPRGRPHERRQARLRRRRQDFTFAYISDAHIQNISETSSSATGTGPHPGGAETTSSTRSRTS